MLWAAFVRSPEAHAKIVSIDTSRRRGARRRRAPCSPARTCDLAGAAADGLGAAGRRGQHARALAAGQGRGQARRRPGRGRHRRATATRVVDAAEDGRRRVRPAAGGRRPRGGARGRRAARPRGARHEQVARVVARRRRPRGGLRRGRRRRRAARSSTTARRARAIEPRGVLADYRAGEPDDLERARRSRTSCACSSRIQLGISEERVRAIAPDVGGGFGSKLQIYGEEILLRAGPSRKLERPVKWIETRSEDMAGLPPRARPDRLRDDGRQARRHDHRAPREDPRRPRRVP